MKQLVHWNFWRGILFGGALFLAVSVLGQARVSAAPLAGVGGPNFAGTATGQFWTTPANATGANDNNCANAGESSNPLDLTNFALNLPAGSTVLGILVEPKAGYSGAHTMAGQLLKAGAPVGTAQNWTPVSAPDCTFTTFQSLGGTSDLWGTTWTVSEINATGFGVRLLGSSSCTANQTGCFVDAVRITITYSVPTPTTTVITSDNPDPSNVGQIVTVTFTVTAQALNAPNTVRKSGAPPSGTVTVNASDSLSCQGSLTNGSGACTITFASVGAKSLTATYPGDANHSGSASAAVPHTVNAIVAPVAAPTATPREVPEADTLLLLGGGLGGVATWARWQWSKRKKVG